MTVVIVLGLVDLPLLVGMVTFLFVNLLFLGIWLKWVRGGTMV